MSSSIGEARGQSSGFSIAGGKGAMLWLATCETGVSPDFELLDQSRRPSLPWCRAIYGEVARPPTVFPPSCLLSLAA